MILRDHALVLRRVRYANTSLVVTYLTRTNGQVAVLAKGARRPRKKGVYDRVPDLLCLGELLWYPRRGGELGIQSEWSESADHPHLIRSLSTIRAAMRVAEVLASLTREAEPSPGLFDQARLALAALNATAALPPTGLGARGAAAGPARQSRDGGGAGPQELSPREFGDRLGLIVLHFDLHALRIAGYCPEFDRCVSCQREPQGQRLGFSACAGGLLCEPCSRNEASEGHGLADGVPLPATALAVARRLLRSGIDVVADIQISRPAHRALRAALDMALVYNLERKMRSFRPPAAQPRWERMKRNEKCVRDVGREA